MLNVLCNFGKTLWGIRFVRFLLVGLLNTAVGYAIFAVLILLRLPIALALGISTALGVIFNYFSTGSLVFARYRWQRFWHFVCGYFAIYVVNVAALYGLDRMSVSTLLAQALLLPPIVGMSFLMSKYIVFRPARIHKT